MGNSPIITPLGTFADAYRYKEALRAAGYMDLGWRNGWDRSTELEWSYHLAQSDDIECITQDASNQVCVIHSQKVFCSLDSGD